ncbi:hypothetical protein W97_00242 [Coniosporium apollinis CBS 100218]|uniref:Cx9C motif-containing protein 4, mitochondrial n=1 Tax=Coniosporium apollinis (strain CBS 100218) TaxID=1168221 RepID=R7YGK8_CONA1|nr:uncharacterized protein W97_00242 [Coniosporium apollinis CBS 100218]EON61032.1 hypothetical protein W97_00242 [Coniosporium apollinis CBS 100218]
MGKMGKMGVEKDMQQDPPCHARACAIQDCIQKNNYNEAKCSKEACAYHGAIERRR